MRILAELVGAVVMLLVFLYGVEQAIEYFSTRESQNATNNIPDAGPVHPAAESGPPRQNGNQPD